MGYTNRLYNRQAASIMFPEEEIRTYRSESVPRINKSSVKTVETETIRGKYPIRVLSDSNVLFLSCGSVGDDAENDSSGGIASIVDESGETV